MQYFEQFKGQKSIAQSTSVVQETRSRNMPTTLPPRATTNKRCLLWERIVSYVRTRVHSLEHSIFGVNYAGRYPVLVDGSRDVIDVDVCAGQGWSDDSFLFI